MTNFKRWIIAGAATAGLAGSVLVGGAAMAQESSPTPTPSTTAPDTSTPKSSDATGQGCDHEKSDTGGTTRTTVTPIA